VLEVRRLGRSDQRFALQARSLVPGAEYESLDLGEFDLDGRELAAYLSDAIDPAFDSFPGPQVPAAQYPQALAAWNQQFLQTLEDLGKQLWLVLPTAFRTEYLRLAGLPEPPRSITLYSDELLFPWEIVRPSGLVNGQYWALPPLGVSHVMGRWRPGATMRPQPQALPVQQVALLMPDAAHSGLPWAEREALDLQSLLPGAQRLAPVNRRSVAQLLDQGSAQLVHFSGHGTLGSQADLNALALEDGEQITAMAFAANRLGATHQPLLYLNACTVGRSARALGRAGGFAGNCIEAGWSGVIAPYWPVADRSAAEFSLAFYRKLRAGRTVGEALCELRGERPDDPSAQAYAYFGDPFARLLWPSVDAALPAPAQAEAAKPKPKPKPKAKPAGAPPARRAGTAPARPARLNKVTP
jgi:hypothetical protein